MAAQMHLPACRLANPDAAVVCPDPQRTGCCPLDHDHAAAANACPGGHGACPEPEVCAMWGAVKAHHVALLQVGVPGTPEPGSAELPQDCPGGHCHKDLPDCTGCRPLTITAMPGSARLLPVTGG
jgi:hypothetical protein